MSIFIFSELDLDDFLNRIGGIHDYFGKKILKPKVVFMECKMKKLKPLVRPAGPFFCYALNETTLVSRFKRRFKKSLILGHKKRHFYLNVAPNNTYTDEIFL